MRMFASNFQLATFKCLSLGKRIRFWSCIFNVVRSFSFWKIEQHNFPTPQFLHISSIVNIYSFNFATALKDFLKNNILFFWWKHTNNYSETNNKLRQNDCNMWALILFYFPQSPILKINTFTIDDYKFTLVIQAHSIFLSTAMVSFCNSSPKDWLHSFNVWLNLPRTNHPLQNQLITFGRCNLSSGQRTTPCQ